jgi:hypothetical protein
MEAHWNTSTVLLLLLAEGDGKGAGCLGGTAGPSYHWGTLIQRPGSVEWGWCKADDLAL